MEIEIHLRRHTGDLRRVSSARRCHKERGRGGAKDESTATAGWDERHRLELRVGRDETPLRGESLIIATHSG